MTERSLHNIHSAAHLSVAEFQLSRGSGQNGPCGGRKRGRPPIAIIDRFWSKVHKTEGCWLWTGTRLRGYGQIAECRNGRSVQRRLWAHRVAWELANGRPVPAGLVVCHRCDTPLCVNPAHLFVGTQLDNIADAMAKGRLTGRPVLGGQRSGRLHFSQRAFDARFQRVPYRVLPVVGEVG